MKRIKLIIEYDGSNYHGLQRQTNAHTIQAEMEQAIERLIGEKCRLIFAGRTDAGVHALGQVGVFDTESSIPDKRWQFALNSVLPPDIRVVKSCKTRPDFHPRFEAVKKHYQYVIFRQDSGQIFWRHHAWCNTEPLNIRAMQEAAKLVEGYQNFRSFCASGSAVKSYDRTVFSCYLREEQPFLKLEIEADGFLYNMVRIIMGTLLEVGRGTFPPQQIKQIIAARDRSAAGPTAPPQGLYLLCVYF